MKTITIQTTVAYGTDELTFGQSTTGQSTLSGTFIRLASDTGVMNNVSVDELNTLVQTSNATVTLLMSETLAAFIQGQTKGLMKPGKLNRFDITVEIPGFTNPKVGVHPKTELPTLTYILNTLSVVEVSETTEEVLDLNYIKKAAGAQTKLQTMNYVRSQGEKEPNSGLTGFLKSLF